MAIISLAAPISGIRGKVGGVVYSQNKSGTYVKAWSRGSNPRTQSQSNQRSALVNASQLWKQITSGQRTDWDTYAALAAQEKFNSLGESYFASGFSWFVELGVNLLSAGESIIDSAPLLGTPGTPDTSNLVFNDTPGSSKSHWTLTAIDPDLLSNHAVKAHVVNSLGVTSFAPVKPFMICEVGTSAGRILSFQIELEEHFGTIQLGQKLFSTIQTQNAEGRRGAMVSGSAEAV